MCGVCDREGSYWQGSEVGHLLCFGADKISHLGSL